MTGISGEFNFKTGKIEPIKVKAKPKTSAIRRKRHVKTLVVVSRKVEEWMRNTMDTEDFDRYAMVMLTAELQLALIPYEGVSNG